MAQDGDPHRGNPQEKKCFLGSPSTLARHRAQHPDSQTILVTGATAGIGWAIVQHLLRDRRQHLLILTGRNGSRIEQLRVDHPDHASRIVTALGDMTDTDYLDNILVNIDFGDKLDALILNHGTLGSCRRINNSDSSDWLKTFQINLFSNVTLIKAALPYLRQSKGRIILTSSGAAQNAYSSWGAYGASKASLNHLAMTVKNEEPEVTTVSIRPGVVDTSMQEDIREKYLSNMDEKDQVKFVSAKKDGKLLSASLPGHVIAELSLRAPKDLSGQFLSWDDPKLADFQEK